MRISIVLVLFLVLSGCTVPTQYSKGVSVKKDANGKILEITETEAVVQQGGRGYPLTFEHLKDVQPQPLEPYEFDGTEQEEDDDYR